MVLPPLSPPSSEEEQDTKTSVVKNNIEQIPKELKASSYEEKLTDVLMQVFEAYGKVLKNQYTPDLSSFRTVNNSLGIYNSVKQMLKEN